MRGEGWGSWERWVIVFLVLAVVGLGYGLYDVNDRATVIRDSTRSEFVRMNSRLDTVSSDVETVRSQVDTLGTVLRDVVGDRSLLDLITTLKNIVDATQADLEQLRKCVNDLIFDLSSQFGSRFFSRCL